MHVAVYAGVPAANHALKIVKQTLAEMEGGEGKREWKTPARGAVPAGTGGGGECRRGDFLASAEEHQRLRDLKAPWPDPGARDLRVRQCVRPSMHRIQTRFG